MDNSIIGNGAIKVIAGTDHWETLSEDSVEYTKLQDTCYESIDLLYELLNEYCIPMVIKTGAIVERKYSRKQISYDDVTELIYDIDKTKLEEILTNFKSACSFLNSVINYLNNNAKLLDNLMKREVSFNSDTNES